MDAKEFAQRKENLGRYFTNDEKWKTNEHGEFTYYKGKRNLKELKFIIELVFGDDLEILSEEYLKNFDDEIIGGSLSGIIYVDANFNGMNQGTAGAEIFIKFTLYETSYSYNQGDSLKNL